MHTLTHPLAGRITRAGATLGEVVVDTAHDLLDVATSARAGIRLALDDLAGRTR